MDFLFWFKSLYAPCLVQSIATTNILGLWKTLARKMKQDTHHAATQVFDKLSTERDLDSNVLRFSADTKSHEATLD